MAAPASENAAARRHPALAPALLALALLAAAGGCDDGPVFREPGDVNGTWALAGDKGSEVFLVVTDDGIDAYTENRVTDCFELVEFAVLGVDGDDFEITDQADTFSIEMRRDGDDLVVSVFGERAVYNASTQNVGALPLCPPGNPAVVCAEQPPIAIGQSIEAALAATDSAAPDGSRRDFYRLEVTTPAELAIDMSSTEVDSYLALYEDDGSLHSENDDRSNLTLDARITATLATGCYILSATSSEPDELGDYTVSVATP